MTKGMGGHHSARSNTDVWLTPPAMIHALGGYQSFDLDPCATMNRPWDTAQHHFTELENGLLQNWFGRVWLNPPYSRAVISKWLGRMAEHGNGISLIFARTETTHFHRYIWPVCDALLFPEGRITFLRPDGTIPRWDGGAPSVLCAYGAENADALAASGIDGAFVPLKFRAFVYGFSSIGTWMEEVIAIMKSFDRTVSLRELYSAMAAHPKAKRNPHWQAKIRQTLQRGPFQSDQIGMWHIDTANFE